MSFNFKNSNKQKFAISLILNHCTYNKILILKSSLNLQHDTPTSLQDQCDTHIPPRTNNLLYRVHRSRDK